MKLIEIKKKAFIDILFLATNLLLFYQYLTSSTLVEYTVYGLSIVYLSLGLKFLLKKDNFILYRIIFLGTIITCIRALTYETFGVIVFAKILTNTIIGIVVFNNGLNKTCQLIFMSIVYSYVGYSYFVVGTLPSEILSGYSHNHVSVILLYSTILFYLSNSSSEIQQKKYSILPASICLLLCVFSLGRSGMISAAVLFILLFALKYQYPLFKGSILTKIWVFAFLVASTFGFLNIFNYFYQSGYFIKFETRMFESERRSMVITDYFKNLDGINFLIGNNSSFFQKEFDIGAHNSYLAWHNFYGIAAVLLLAYTLLVIIRFFRTDKYHLILLLPILIRSLTDTILFFQGIMFGLLFVILLVTSERQKSQKNIEDSGRKNCTLYLNSS